MARTTWTCDCRAADQTAAKLATLPTTSTDHGITPPRLPERESASTVIDAATIIASTHRSTAEV